MSIPPALLACRPEPPLPPDDEIRSERDLVPIDAALRLAYRDCAGKLAAIKSLSDETRVPAAP